VLSALNFQPLNRNLRPWIIDFTQIWSVWCIMCLRRMGKESNPPTMNPRWSWGATN